MKRAPLLLGILGFVLITVAWWFLLMAPKNRAIDAANQTTDSIVAERSSLQSQIDSLNRIKDSEVTFIFAIGDMETSVPVNPELDAFIEDLTFLAERSGIDIETFATSPPAPSPVGEGLFEIQVSLTIQGEYFEVLGFLFGLEDLERLVRVDSVTLVPLGAEPEETAAADDDEVEPRPRAPVGTLQVQIVGKVFTRTGVVVEAPEEPADGGAESTADEQPADDATDEDPTTEEGDGT